MTDAQLETLAKVEELLREHFESVLLVLNTRVEEDDNKEVTKVCWHGGSYTALGLAEYAKKYLLDYTKPEDD